MTHRSAVAVVATAALAASVVSAQGQDPLYDGQCRKFSELYDNGKDLADTMWFGSFEYVPSTSPTYDLAYHMWWFTDTNPNDDVTALRVSKGLHPVYQSTDTCWLNYLGDRPSPGPQPPTLTECIPWRKNACCAPNTVANVTKINTDYGPEWRWDRCGPLSEACERFFVQEACLYECDANAGLFRKYPPTTFDPNNKTQNNWEISYMPIRAEYFDAWYAACAEDRFCASSDGNFWDCARTPPTPSPVAPIKEPVPMSSGAIAGIVIVCVVAVFSTCFCCIMLKKEKDGEPIFMPLAPSEFGSGRPENQGNTAADRPDGSDEPSASKGNEVVAL